MGEETPCSYQGSGPFPTIPNADVPALPNTHSSAEAGIQPPRRDPESLLRPRPAHPGDANPAKSTCDCLICFSKASDVNKRQQVSTQGPSQRPEPSTTANLCSKATLTASFLVTCFHLFLVAKCKQKHLCLLLFLFLFCFFFFKHAGMF